MERSIDDAKEKVQSAVKDVTSEVQSRYEKAKERIDDLRSKEWGEIFDDAADFVTQHPLPMLVGALLIGYGLGRVFGNRE